MSDSKLSNTTTEKTKPNETSGFVFSSAIKIIDPNTKQVLVQKRAD
jgi:hypothetical protein